MTQQPGPIATGAIYTVQDGDTLQLIAERAYGDSTKWQWIYNWTSNKQLIGDNPDLIQPGWNLYIPSPLEVPSGGGGGLTT